MNRKSLITLALASAFAFSTPMLYADGEKQEAPKPELISQSDEQSTSPTPAPAPELISQSDEQSTSPAPAPAPELIAA